MQQSIMQTPKRSLKSQQSNDSNQQMKPPSQQHNSASKLKGEYSNTSKRKSESKNFSSQILSSNSKSLKQPPDMMMISGPSTKITQGKLIDSNAKGKPIKATISYGLRLSGYEERSRQSQNCLNQSLSESNAYDSNLQLMDDLGAFPHSMRGSKDLRQEYYEHYDQPTNLITYKQPEEEYSTSSQQTQINPYKEGQPAVLHSSVRRFSNSTEKLMSNTQILNMLTSHHQHNNSSSSIGLNKQRRSRTQRRLLRERSQEGDDREDQVKYVVEQQECLQFRVDEHDLKSSLQQSIQIVHDDKIGIFNMNEVFTVDDFAKSLVNHSYIKTVQSNSSQQIIPEQETKAGNFQDISSTKPEYEPHTPQPLMSTMPQSHILSTEDSDPPKPFSPPKEQPKPNLNEDINMQLYGQISMFDQLTDYNENDNEEGSQNAEEGDCHGEESFDDNGEGDDNQDLREYRQRIEVINEDINSFIMDAGEDGEGTSNNMLSSNPLHNLQVNTQCNQIFEEPEEHKYVLQDNDTTNMDFEQNLLNQMTPMNHQENDIILQQEQILSKMNDQIHKLLQQVNGLEGEVNQKQLVIDTQKCHIHQLNKEKCILQDILECKKLNEQAVNERMEVLQEENEKQAQQLKEYREKEVEAQEKMSFIAKENQVLRAKLAQFFSVQQKQKSMVSLEDKTNTQSPRPTNNNIAFRKFTKASTSNKASPKGNGSAYKDQDTLSDHTKARFDDKRKSVVYKSIDTSMQSANKNLLDKILQLKPSDNKKHNFNSDKKTIQSAAQKMTPQKSRTNMKGSVNVSSAFGTSVKSSIYSSSSKSKVLKESYVLSPKSNGKCENFPRVYYQ